jgi:hypothetical protein
MMHNGYYRFYPARHPWLTKTSGKLSNRIKFYRFYSDFVTQLAKVAAISIKIEDLSRMSTAISRQAQAGEAAHCGILRRAAGGTGVAALAFASVLSKY